MIIAPILEPQILQGLMAFEKESSIELFDAPEQTRIYLVGHWPFIPYPCMVMSN
jgi:hypothetical protein